MDLFEVTNGQAFPSTHALLIEPFKSIYSSDNSEDKGRAIKVFTYIELVCSPKKSNPFFGYSEEDRPSKVKKEIYGDENYPTTDFMMQGVIKFKELLEVASPTYSLFLASLQAAEDLKQNLYNINLDERTNGGAAVTKPRDVTSALREIPDVVKSLETMRTKVNSELLEESKTRNQREIGLYER